MTVMRLSQAESQRIIAEDILPTYLPGNLRPLDRPAAVLLGPPNRLALTHGGLWLSKPFHNV